MNTRLARLDRRIAGFMSRTGGRALRLSLATIFFWFGILKVFGISPAEPLLRQTVEWLPMLTADAWVPVIGWWEVAIGLTFLFPATIRIAIALLAGQMVGTFLPLIVLPEVTFQPGRVPYAPTLEGQYIIKNLLIISAALVIGGTIGGRREADRPADREADGPAREPTRGGASGALAGLLGILLVGCASARPEADPGSPSPADAVPWSEATMDEVFTAAVGSTPAEAAARLGEARSVTREPVENLHVPGQIDTLATYRYDGIEVAYYRINGGRDLLTRVRATRAGFPGGTPFDVGDDAQGVADALGEPQAHTAEGWRYEEELYILLVLVRDSRVAALTYLPYVD